MTYVAFLDVHNAILFEALKATGWVFALILGVVAGFTFEYFFGDRPFFARQSTRNLLKLCVPLFIVLASAALLSGPTPSFSASLLSFVACALMAFWVGNKPKSATTVSVSLRPGIVRLLPTGSSGKVLKLEVKPDEDMTVKVVYNDKEVFSQDVVKGTRYSWSVELPAGAGTAVVYLVTKDGWAWAGSKDYAS